MLTKDEEDFLNKIPADKKVYIYPFGPKVVRMAEDLIQSISNIFPDLEVKHMGASALGISGQNDIDIYAFSEPKDFEKFLPGLVKLFGKPLHRHETFIEWKFKREEFDIEFYLTTKDSKTMKKQLAVFETLKNNKGLLKKYENLKESMNGKSLRKYQEKKYEFYHRILDNKIKAIIFDIGGVLTYNVGGYIRNDITKTLSVTKDQYENACHILVPLLNTDKITEKEFWERFILLTKSTQKLPENLWGRVFLKRRKLRKDVIQIIKGLKKEGLKLAALTNVIRAHSRVNDEKGIYKLFDICILSYEVKLRKPDLKIFKLTLKKLGTRPEETVFIDNKLINVESAKRLGINGIYFRNVEQLKKDLKKLGYNMNF